MYNLKTMKELMEGLTVTQYKENLKSKIIRYITDELKGNPIEFDQMFKVDITTDNGVEEWIVRGINEEGLLYGNADWGDSLGDEVEFDIHEIDVETLSYIMDQLTEYNL